MDTGKVIKNIGIIGYGGVGINYSDLIKLAIAEEERKQREILLRDLDAVNKTTEINQSSLHQLMLDMIDEGQRAKELLDSLNKITELIPQEPTLEQLKKQIKYSKNPLEVKMLNKKLNQMYKKMRRR